MEDPCMKLMENMMDILEMAQGYAMIATKYKMSGHKDLKEFYADCPTTCWRPRPSSTPTCSKRRMIRPLPQTAGSSTLGAMSGPPKRWPRLR